LTQKSLFSAELLEKMETIDPEEFVKQRIEQHEKEEMEKARRLAKLDKRLDWVERVIRLEESPLISQSFQKQLEDDKKI